MILTFLFFQMTLNNFSNNFLCTKFKFLTTFFKFIDLEILILMKL